MGVQGAATLQAYREAHPEWTRQNAVRALVKAREVKLAGLARARELREQEQARLRLLSKFPRKASPAEQIKWLSRACLKIAQSPVAPPKWMLPALTGMLACVRALPADSGEAQRNADAAHIAFLQKEVKRLEAAYAESQHRLQEAEQRTRERAAEAAAAREVVIEPAPKTAAPPGVPAEVHVWAWQQNGLTHLGLTVESSTKVMGFPLTEMPVVLTIR